MNTSIKVETGPAAVEALRDEWRSLATETRCAPFLTWEWMSAWQDHFGSKGDPLIVKTYRGDSLVGLLPLSRVRKGMPGLTFTRVGFLGEGPGAGDHLDLIAMPEDHGDALTASLRWLAGSRFDLISLDNLDAGSATVEGLRAANSVRYCEHDGYACPQVDLTAGWEAVLTGSRRRSNFRRRLRRLAERRDFAFRSVTAPEELGAAFERFLALHGKRRPGRSSELSGSARLVDFHRDVIERMSSTGVLRFDELWCEGECRASVYAFDNGRTFYYYNTGFDTDWADRSVGLVLTGLSIRAAAERGAITYDFLRGDEAYKFDWATRTERLLNVTVAGESTAARVAFVFAGLDSRFRSIAKSLLPRRLASATRRALSWPVPKGNL